MSVGPAEITMELMMPEGSAASILVKCEDQENDATQGQFSPPTLSLGALLHWWLPPFLLTHSFTHLFHHTHLTECFLFASSWTEHIDGVNIDGVFPATHRQTFPTSTHTETHTYSHSIPIFPPTFFLPWSIQICIIHFSSKKENKKGLLEQLFVLKMLMF